MQNIYPSATTIIAGTKHVNIYKLSLYIYKKYFYEYKKPIYGHNTNLL